MITQLHVQGYKSLRDVTIPFARGITVLVGPNNSGKSAVLQVLEAVGGVARHKTTTFLGDLRVISAGMKVAKADVVVGTPSEFGPHTFRSMGGCPTLSPEHRAALAGIVRFDLSVSALRQPCSVAESPVLASDGSNIAAVLDALANEKPEIRERIDAAVRASATEIIRITTPTVAGQKIVAVQEKDGVFRADAISDGVLLLIGLATVCHAGERPTMLCVEEPEKGIHPRRIREVIDQFRRVAQEGTQVGLTTHSPLVLDQFRDDPDAVVILDRDGDGTRARRLSELPEIQDDLKNGLPLGDAWYSGLLGGVPQ